MTLATDDIGGIHYQLIKLAFGALETATLVTGSVGLPVSVLVGSATIGAVTGPTADNAANPALKLSTLPAVALAAAPTRTEGNVNPLRVTLAGDLVMTLDSEAVVLGAGVAEIGKLAAGTANIGDVDVLSIAAGDNNIGNVDIVTLPALVAGTANIGDVDVLTLPALIAGTALVGDVGLGVRTSGGLSIFKSIDLDETEEAVKATAGQIYAMHITNLTAAPIYLKLYNATVATVVVGTTVPDITITIPANADSDGAGFTWTIPQGIAFSTAITAAATTGVADADAGAPAANAVVACILYA